MPAKRGRPRKSYASARRDGKANPPPAPAKTAATKAWGEKRPRPVAPDPDEDELQEGLSSASTQQHSGRQKVANTGDGRTTSAKSTRRPRIKFPFLKAQTRNIPKSIIASKWKAAPIPAQQAAREILVNAKRGVMLDRYDNKRRIEAEIDLASVLRNLEKKLPRVPFPPRTGESQFDLDKVMEHNRALENDLTPALHAVELLETAVRQERNTLQQEHRLMAKLEEDLRTEDSFQRRTVKIHPQLQEPHTGANDGPSGINLVSNSPSEQHEQIDWTHDEDVEPLLGQLRGHLQSLKTNAGQVEGLDVAISDAYAALDGALTRHTKYDHDEKLSF